MLLLYRRRIKRIIFFGVVLVLVFLVLASLFLLPRTQNSSKTRDETLQPSPSQTFTELPRDPLDLQDYLKVDVSLVPGKILLSRNCTAVVISAITSKTFSIERGIENKTDVRPNEHDLIRDIIENYNIRVLFVTIDELKEDLYYASIFLKKDTHVLNLDAKPSDALAIAARFRASVYIQKDIFETNTQNICS